MKIHRSIPIATMLVLALLLGACGGAKSTPAPEPTATQPPAQPEPTAAPEEASAPAAEESAPAEEEAATSAPEEEAAPAAEESAPAEEETAAPAAGEEAGLSAEAVTAVTNAVDGLLQQIVDPAMQSIPNALGPAPGAVIRLDAPGLNFLEAAGLASVEDGTPMEADVPFEIGSNTKMFTAVMLMQLDEEGVLSLDDPLSKWLPEWAEKIPNGDQMTLHQLANHTSGIWDYADDILGAAAKDEDAMRRAYTPEELVQYTIDNGTPDFAPGEEGQWNYSNTGYILLGLVLEAATRQEYTNLLQERILDPLEMTETSFPNDVPEPGSIVDGYTAYPDGKNATQWNLSQAWTAGGVISTAADMTTFLQALANGQLFQDPQTLLKMADFVEYDVITQKIGVKGYGIGLLEFVDGVWGHGGQTLGFESALMFVPGTEITLAGLTNAGIGPLQSLYSLAPLLQQIAGVEQAATPGAESASAGETATEASAAASEFPRPEPDYNAKRPRDFTPFEEALSALTPERVAELDGLLTGATVLDIQQLLDDGQLTSEELVTYYVDRIQRYDLDALNSVMELNPDALAIARQLDQERADGGARGPMHGIPVLLKDNIAAEGMHVTAGAYAMQDWMPDRDAFLVKQLRDAGAIILGKANLSEWANYMDPNMPSGFSVLGGQTRNPYGPYEVWGSSSGSAVAASASFAAVTVGTETQGSIIAPAGINGAVAIKTSKGLVSGDYIIPLIDWQDVAGPMGRTVTDVAVLLTAMAGADENDPATQNAAELAGTDFTQFLSPEAAQGMRIGIVILSEESADQIIEDAKIPDDQVDQTKQALLAQNDLNRQLASFFEAAGMEAVEVDSADLPPRSDTNSALEYGFKDSLNRFLANVDAPVESLADVIAINNEDLANRAPYGQGFLEGSQNTAITQEEYDALKEKNHASAADGLSAIFDKYEIDVLLTDTQEYAPAGFPAITVPLGYDPNSGQPIPLMLIGDYLGEPKLITAAYIFEQASQARQEPDLETTIQQIQEAVGK
jgi:amidase